MSDLISRSALLAKYDRIHVGEPGKARKLIAEAPAVDAVEVVHGRWAVKCESHLDQASGEFDEDYYIECSECGRKVWDISQDAALFGDWQKIFNDFPYCHCGAKMDGGNDG